MSLTNLLLNMRPLHIGHRIALTLILILLAVAPSLANDGNISGTGSDTDPYIIHDAKDWETFAKEVNNGNTYVKKFIKLELDISVTQQVGSYTEIKAGNSTTLIDKPFSGTFDGNGRTIHADITESDGMGTALFGYINGAIIKNLTVTGEIHGGIHAAGLVGISKGSGNRIENCVVATTVNGGTHIGGVLGHGSTSDIAIDNCVFNGILDGGSKAKGVFFGWGDNGGTKTVSNCLYIQQDGQGTDNLDLVQMNAGSVAVTDCYKTADVGTYGTLAYLNPPTDAITEEKTVAGNTKFYVVTGYVIAVTSATTEMTTGAYRVSDDITVDERIVINGDVTLILDEGKTLNATKGIELSDGNKLTIDGKGTLNATGDENFAGIGASEVGTLVIENGIVNATGGYNGAGIGGSKQNSVGGTITINGGTVTSIGGSNGSGIGGGNITINGGTVTSKGGKYASGIGGGNGASGGNIIINGGMVSSTGGMWGAGIGGGYRGPGGTVILNGGKVTAFAGENASGMGPGYRGTGGTVMLGWTSEDDFIYADNYDNVQSIGFIYNENENKEKHFYYVLGGKNKVASIDDIGGKTIYPYYGENSLKNAMVSGIIPYYYYTGNDISIAYTVVDYNGKTLVKETDYTEEFSQWPIKERGEYTLTLIAKEGSGYTDSKSIRFTVDDAILVTDKTIEMTSGVYRVSTDVTVNTHIVVNGNVVLVLDEGKMLIAKRGIEVPENNALTIEGEGTLEAKGNGKKAGIGGGDGASGGNITINGGTVTSTGDQYAAGIGGGKGGSGGIITINGGTVTSKGGQYAAGIGGGKGGSGGNITINGGTITSKGGSTAAGIGGGNGKSGGLITINDGFVIAEGGGKGSSSSDRGGSGIGGGCNGIGGSITINGGTVISTGEINAAGIGGGNEASGGDITINGGSVTSNGGNNAAGIGGGYKGFAETINIYGGRVTAFAGTNASFGIGPGEKGSGGTVMLGWTNDDDFIYADKYNVLSTSFIYDKNENKEKQFYFVEHGEKKIASIDDIGGKTIYPYYGEKNLKNATISGINPYYYYTGNDISIAYTVVDYNGKTLVKETDYTEEFSQWPIKERGEYTLTLIAKEGSGYTDSKSIRFTVDDAILVTDKTIEMTSGVYRVSTDVTVNTHIVVNGNVVLVLDDGITLTARYGIEVSYGNELTIDGNGVLKANQSNPRKYAAGIGGGENYSGGTIIINGGTVISTGGEDAAGIGGGKGGSGGTITINGGTVTSTSGSSGSGIGGGDGASGGNITINGGTVISIGVRSVSNSDGSGIGGGNGGSGGSIAINGGTVTSTGGNNAAGIGGGRIGSGGNITISGGKITANAGEKASGVGAGREASGGSVTLGWTNDDDFIHATSFNVESISFAQDFYYTENGVNKVASIDDVAGKTLYPLTSSKNLSFANISGIQPYYIYTRENIEMAYKVTDIEGEELVVGTDYTASLNNSSVEDEFSVKDVGDYMLTITAIDGSIYTGSKSVVFSVVKSNLENAVFSGINPYYRYTGDEIGLSYKVVDSEGKELVVGTDYTASLNNSSVEDVFSVKDVGDYTLTITAKDGSFYTGSKEISFVVYSDYVPVRAFTFSMDGSYGVPYKVDKDVSIDERISIIGEVRLILDEGVTLNASKGIELSENNKLTIEGEGTLNAVGANYNSGIGAYNVGTLVINGGKINATGGMFGAGIGGGVITINGGIVNATGGYDAAGIGGGHNDWAGDYGACGLIIVNGGKVTANAGVNASGIGPGSQGKTSGSVILGWTNEDDFIYANNFNNVSSLTFAENKQFYYTENGVNKVASIDDIAGKELHPYFGDHNLENASISGVEPSYTYTGKAISPTFKVADFNGEEISEDNYVVSIMRNGVVTSAVNTGEYTMVFTGKGEYKGTKEVKFSIVPKVILASGAIQVFEDENGKRAEIDGEYEGTDAVNITEDIKDVAVTFNREFTPNSGHATIMFPFDVKASSLTGVKSVIEFTGITKIDGNNAVGMGYVWCNATLGEQEELNKHPNCNGYSGELKAYTPYMIEMESATLGIKDAVTLKSNSGKIVGDAPVGNWVFRGTLQKKEWPKGTGIINEGRLWAFSAAERSGAKIGEFVQFGGNNWANPFRAYLVECKKTDNGLDCKDDSEIQPSLVSRYRFADALASTDSAATDQPLVMRRAAASETASLNSMDIVIVYGDKESDGDKERPTVIGHFNPATGEIRMLPRTKQTYDLKGRRVGNGKKAKGAYYNRR